MMSETPQSNTLIRLVYRMLEQQVHDMLEDGRVTDAEELLRGEAESIFPETMLSPMYERIGAQKQQAKEWNGQAQEDVQAGNYHAALLLIAKALKTSNHYNTARTSHPIALAAWQQAMRDIKKLSYNQFRTQLDQTLLDQPTMEQVQRTFALIARHKKGSPELDVLATNLRHFSMVLRSFAHTLGVSDPDLLEQQYANVVEMIKGMEAQCLNEIGNDADWRRFKEVIGFFRTQYQIDQPSNSDERTEATRLHSYFAGLREGGILWDTVHDLPKTRHNHQALLAIQERVRDVLAEADNKVHAIQRLLPTAQVCEHTQRDILLMQRQEPPHQIQQPIAVARAQKLFFDGEYHAALVTLARSDGNVQQTGQEFAKHLRRPEGTKSLKVQKVVASAVLVGLFILLGIVIWSRWPAIAAWQAQPTQPTDVANIPTLEGTNPPVVTSTPRSALSMTATGVVTGNMPLEGTAVAGGTAEVTTTRAVGLRDAPLAITDFSPTMVFSHTLDSVSFVLETESPVYRGNRGIGLFFRTADDAAIGPLTMDLALDEPDLSGALEPSGATGQFDLSEESQATLQTWFLESTRPITLALYQEDHEEPLRTVDDDRPIVLTVDLAWREMQGVTEANEEEEPDDFLLIEDLLMVRVWLNTDQTRQVDAPKGKTFLAQGDEVEIIDEDGEYYRVRIVSTFDSENDPGVIGRTGWVKKIYVDGS
jgi:hypothetical protein